MITIEDGKVKELQFSRDYQIHDEYDEEDLFEDDEEDDEDTLQDRFITFTIQDENYGFELFHVTEIISVQKITHVPEMPDFVKGVINLRGRVVPVIDVRIRFGLSPIAYNDKTCIIVVCVNETDIGLVVDTVNEVIVIPEENISQSPEVNRGKTSRFIKGMGYHSKKVTILLDIYKLLYDKLKNDSHG